MTNFADRLIGAIEEKQTPCVVGIDPAIKYLPEDFIRRNSDLDRNSSGDCAELLCRYSLHVIDSVADLVPAVKPQSAYFERYGSDGIRALEKVIAHARAQGLIIILDAKRGDIGATSEAYASSYLSDETPAGMCVDCMTLNPYLGDDSMAPFAEASHRYGKGVFICVLTSNPGSNLFQALISDGRPIYQWVADMVSGLASQQIGNRGYSSVGAVVGATHPEQASMLRKQLPSSLFLVPGFGAQQGSLDAIKNCFNRDGLGAVISSSRSIMYPHLFGPAGHAEMAVREATQHFIAEVASCLRIL